MWETTKDTKGENLNEAKEHVIASNAKKSTG